MQWTWVSIALGAHAAWGLYPVLARYLQTESLLPTFSILALGNLFVLLTAGRYLWRNTELSAFRMPLLWLFGLIRLTTGDNQYRVCSLHVVHLRPIDYPGNTLPSLF